MRNPIETLMGGIIFVFAVAFLITGYLKADVKNISGYQVKAIFSKVGGITIGNDVKINGIKVGSVADVVLNKDYNAEVTLNIKYDINIPSDTVASVSADGIIGDKFINLNPGKSDQFISHNNKGEISYIRNYKSLEDMVSEVVFSMTNSGN